MKMGFLPPLWPTKFMARLFINPIDLPNPKLKEMRDSFLNTFDLFSNHFKLGSDVIADLLCLDFNCVFKR